MRGLISRIPHAQYEGSQQGVTWDTAGDDDFGVQSALNMLFFDIFFWLFIAWYADQVFPSEYGIQRKPWFLCSPSYWCGPSNDDSRGNQTRTGLPPLAVENLPEPVTDRGVSTKGLCKVWGKTVAVHELDIEMSPGQITSLLGANGAGKTTTISMLTGLLTPSRGDACIDGKSITTMMPQIRLSLGVCPQAPATTAHPLLTPDSPPYTRHRSGPHAPHEPCAPTQPVPSPTPS